MKKLSSDDMKLVLFISAILLFIYVCCYACIADHVEFILGIMIMIGSLLFMFFTRTAVSVLISYFIFIFGLFMPGLSTVDTASDCTQTQQVDEFSAYDDTQVDTTHVSKETPTYYDPKSGDEFIYKDHIYKYLLKHGVVTINKVQ